MRKHALRATFQHATVLAVIAILAVTGNAQPPSARTVSGRVIDEGGQPVPLATVSTPSGAQTTTRPDGTFRLPLASANNTNLIVRQIGFHPESLTVTPDQYGVATSSLMIRISRNTIQLTPVVVNARQTCIAGDFRDVEAKAELRPVFDALQENVQRSLTLLRGYPLRADMAVTFYDSNDTGRSKEKQHKTKRSSAGTWMPYEPGNVVKHSDKGMMIVPVSLGFFVDTVFQSHHCFRYAGQEVINGRPALRVDFAPNTLVKGVDWAGSILLDGKTYVLREKRSSLTYPPNTTGKLQYVNWSTMYEEIFPGLIDLASDRRAQWAGDSSQVAVPRKFSVIETRTVKRTWVKGAPESAPPN